MIFKDRSQAGKLLAKELKRYRGKKDAVVVALPRGGVVLGYEIAVNLKLPLDIVVPRKIGAPGNPEFAIGAITEDGEFIENPEGGYAPEDYMKKEIAKEMNESARRLEIYRSGMPERKLADKTVLLVDDGIATGLTLEAGIRTVRKQKAGKIVVAVPVAAEDSYKKIKMLVDDMICLDRPFFFGAVGAFYESFPQTQDSEVVELLQKANQ